MIGLLAVYLVTGMALAELLERWGGKYLGASWFWITLLWPVLLLLSTIAHLRKNRRIRDWLEFLLIDLIFFGPFLTAFYLFRINT